MFRRIGSHLRQHTLAAVALFFALSGTTLAAADYITKSQTITQGDLIGSTYGDPVIAAHKVTNGKLAHPSFSLNAGAGLTGGGSIALGGSSTLSANTAALQARISGTCSVGTAMTAVAQSGAPTCSSVGQGTVTQINAGNGLTGGPITSSGTLSVDFNKVQAAIDADCPDGTAVGAIDPFSGAVHCNASAHSFFQSVPYGSSQTLYGPGVTNGVDVLFSCTASAVSAALQASPPGQLNVFASGDESVNNGPVTAVQTAASVVGVSASSTLNLDVIADVNGSYGVLSRFDLGAYHGNNGCSIWALVIPGTSS